MGSRTRIFNLGVWVILSSGLLAACASREFGPKSERWATIESKSESPLGRTIASRGEDALVEEIFPGLPAVLEHMYGRAGVEVSRSEEISVRYVPYSRTVWTGGGGHGDGPGRNSGSRNPFGTFYIRGPFRGNGLIVSLDVAREFVQAVLKRVYVPTRTNIQSRIQDQLADYGAHRLLNVPSAEETPEFISLWWQLRMVGTEPSRGALKAGDKVLIGLWTNGYKGSSFTPGDFGHAAVGLRTVGGDPNQDFMLNPGAKNPPGVNPTMVEAVVGNRLVPNRATTFNLWDWSETQRDQRYLNVHVRMFRISPEQARAMELLRQEASDERLQWGKFMMLANSCADGALDIYNSLLPLDKTIDAKDVGWIITPEEVIDSAGRSFGVEGGLVLEQATPPAGAKTPDAEVKTLGNRATSGSYVDYLEEENRVLNRLL